MNDLGNLIKSRREELSMTQRDLAKMTGTNNATISRIESGEIIKPDSSILYELSSALKLDYLFLLSLAGYISIDEELRQIIRLYEHSSAEEKKKIFDVLQKEFDFKMDYYISDFR